MPTTSSGYWFPTEVDNAQLETTFATAASSQQVVFDGIDNRVGIVEGELGTRLPRYAYGTRAELDATVGVAGQVNVVTADPNPNNNGDYEWNGTAWAATVNYVQRYSETQQNIANATTTTVVLNDEIISKGNQLSATGTGAVTVLADGVYRCFGTLSYFPLTGTTSVVFLKAYLAVNGSWVVMGNAGTTSILAEGGRASVEQSLELVAGDIVTLLARHSVSPVASRPISTSAEYRSILIVEKM